MEQRQCCDTMASGGRMDATLPSEGASIEQAIMACCTNAITGGLHNLTALFEKQSKTEDQKLSPAISERDLSSQFSYPATEIRFFIQRTQAASPPSVEKYVLFASLLI